MIVALQADKLERVYRMEQNQSYLINKIFTIPYLDKVVGDKDRTYLEQYILRYVLNAETKTMSYGEAVSEIYSQMDKEHRNEYYFKNAILNQLLIERHELTHTAALTELPIAESKADMVLINGKGIVYEIKTDLDDFSRLECQINDYYKAFSYVNVVVGQKYYKKAKELLKDTKVGIYVLYDSGNLLPRKKAKCNREQLSYESMFRILRKNEYESILLKYNKHLPQTNSFQYYRECYRRMKKLGTTTVQKEMQECLKKRMLLQHDYSMEEKIPYSLRFYAYFTKEEKYEKIKKFVGGKVRV